MPGPAWTRIVPGRGVKRIVSAGGRVAAACGGGTVEVLARGGKLIGSRSLYDIASLAWAGARRVAGLSDGRFVALQIGAEP